MTKLSESNASDGKNDVLVVGHRGNPESYPENTLIGLLSAIDQGVPAIEFDVQMSRDGVPVLLHDGTLDRTSNTSGVVFDKNIEELKDVLVDEPKRFNNVSFGTRISTLQAVSGVLSNYDIKVFIEIKEESYKRFDRNVIADAIVNESEPMKKRVFISYDIEILKYIRRRYKVKVGWVLRCYDKVSKQRAEEFKPEILICNHKKIGNPNNVWKLSNTAWFLYDLKTPEDAKPWILAGVKYIESWNPSLLCDYFYQGEA